MPMFTIVELVREEREVEAETAQDALDLWLIHGEVPGVSEASVCVNDRWVEDEDGNHCDTEETDA